jgi:hypothetical protein
MKTFHLGDVLTVTTGGILVAPGGIAAVQHLLDFMTGDVLSTHQLPRALNECRPILLARYPHLPSAIGEFASSADANAWLAEQVRLHGEYLDVEPLAPEDHTHINPLVEMQTMMPHAQIIPIVVGESS